MNRYERIKMMGKFPEGLSHDTVFAELLMLMERFDEAVSILNPLADAGDIIATERLAQLHLGTPSVPEAKILFQKLHSGGDIRSLGELIGISLFGTDREETRGLFAQARALSDDGSLPTSLRPLWIEFLSR